LPYLEITARPVMDGGTYSQTPTYLSQWLRPWAVRTPVAAGSSKSTETSSGDLIVALLS
jgi:hypothetical protein